MCYPKISAYHMEGGDVEICSKGLERFTKSFTGLDSKFLIKVDEEGYGIQGITALVPSLLFIESFSCFHSTISRILD